MARARLRDRRRRRRAGGPWGESLAPLIDVLFLLLIFLLVTARYDRQRVLDVQLPEASTARAAPPVNRDQERVVTLRADGSLTFNGVPTDLDTLGGFLLELPPEERLLPIFIRADEDAPLGHGVRVLDRLRQLGFANAFLEVRPPTRPAGAPR